MRGENDNPDEGGSADFRASPVALAMPVVIIAAGYALLFASLALSEKAAGPLGRLCLVVLSLGVPFLIAHAVLRYLTIRVQTAPHAVFIHSGFPRARAVEIAYPLIERISVKRGPGGWVVGSGTLVVELLDGARIAAADIAEPEAAQRAIGDRISALPPAATDNLRPLLRSSREKTAAAGG